MGTLQGGVMGREQNTMRHSYPAYGLFIKARMLLIGSLILLAATFCSCSCQDSHMIDVPAFEYGDGYSDCQDLVNNIKEVEFFIKRAVYRYKHPSLFTSSPICVFSVMHDAVRNQYFLYERLQYWKNLYGEKGCKTYLHADDSRYNAHADRVNTIAILPPLAVLDD